MNEPIVIAIDGTSASGKSTNAKLVAQALGFVYVDTGAMYRTLAWYCLKNRIDFHDAKAVANACRRWKTKLECIQFGNLVMEGRDIGTNVFPETDYKYYLDAHLEERTKRRAAEGVNENLAARDQRDSQRASAPLMIALGAKVLNNSNMTAAETSGWLLKEIRARFAEKR